MLAIHLERRQRPGPDESRPAVAGQHPRYLARYSRFGVRDRVVEGVPCRDRAADDRWRLPKFHGR
jgi:hypothetical protein